MKLYALCFHECDESGYIRVFKSEEARNAAISKYIDDKVEYLLEKGYSQTEIRAGCDSVFVSGSDIFYDYEELDCELEE